MTTTIKLTKDNSQEYHPIWAAEDTQYFTNIYADKHHAYTLYFTLKDGINSHDTAYYSSNRQYDLRLLSDVKNYIAQIDQEFEAAVLQSKKETEERDLACVERKNRIDSLNIFESDNSYTPELNELLTLKYANLNKNCTIGEYRFEVEENDFTEQLSKVEKVVNLSAADYDDFAVNLMANHNFLGNGGTDSDAPELKNLNVDYHQLTVEQQQLFKETCFNLVTAIVAPGRETIYVDAQGYGYARYVAFNESIKKVVEKSDNVIDFTRFLNKKRVAEKKAVNAENKKAREQERIKQAATNALFVGQALDNTPETMLSGALNAAAAEQDLIKKEDDHRVYVAYCDPENEVKGSKYDATKHLDIKEIARRVRADIKQAIKDKLIPKIKTSVRIDRYSMGQSLGINITSLPDNLRVYTPEYMQASKNLSEPADTLNGFYESITTADYDHIYKILEQIMNSYNRNNSDSMTDYYDVNFSGHVGIDWKYKQVIKAREVVILN